MCIRDSLYTMQDTGALRREHEAAKRIGMGMQLTEKTELPFQVKLALKLEGQGRFHPLRFLYMLAEEMCIRDSIYDLLVLDIGLFCHSKKTRIPGTEDMDKEYRNPRHHIIGAGTGIIIGAVVALLSGGIIHVVSIYLLV